MTSQTQGYIECTFIRVNANVQFLVCSCFKKEKICSLTLCPTFFAQVNTPLNVLWTILIAFFWINGCHRSEIKCISWHSHVTYNIITPKSQKMDISWQALFPCHITPSQTSNWQSCLALNLFQVWRMLGRFLLWLLEYRFWLYSPLGVAPHWLSNFL